MTTRFTFAIIYALSAAVVGLCALSPDGGHATAPATAPFAIPGAAEIDPARTGYAEADDLPAYLTGHRAAGPSGIQAPLTRGDRHAYR